MTENQLRQLQPITSRDQLTQQSPMSDQSSLENLRKLNAAAEVIEKILKRYPDYGKASDEYVAALTQLVANYDYKMHRRLEDIMTGVSARFKFLPTVADIADLAREFENKFAPIPTTHRYFAPEPDPPPLSPAARARMQKLVDELHRDWDEPRKSFAYRPADEIKSSADLKTPDGPISDELRRKLIDEDWPYFAAQSSEKAA